MDKNLTLSVFSKEQGIYIIVKKDLVDYKVEVYASEAPILNQFTKIPEPFEFIVVEREILYKELENVDAALKIAFGNDKDFTLTSVRVAIGSSEDDFVTIDSSDLGKYNVIPTIPGLADFFNDNKESILGFCDARFEPDKGNMFFIEGKVTDPDPEIFSIEVKVMNSIQQRGILMQKKQSYVGAEMYIIIKANSITDLIVDFLRELEVDWDMVTMRRELSILDWIEVESERSSVNLKSYLRAKNPELDFFEINLIVTLCIKNQLNFKIADKCAELLRKLKQERIQNNQMTPTDQLTKDEIFAAAKVSCSYHGTKKTMEVESDQNADSIDRFEKEILNL